ncbi:hypothetical protein CERSUDRAFT_93207 [Gelatoporia subvermispora B]|uniref:Uncharacterized protein n=1 Tax=Ceriporiopsis subvermispora (strain B) TaxID=914234 RepID=M2PRE0_CERS8|nr:hypothetical protein CERSUDRAFT_93207 [Gelatoporia subvermispora B]
MARRMKKRSRQAKTASQAAESAGESEMEQPQRRAKKLKKSSECGTDSDLPSQPPSDNVKAADYLAQRINDEGVFQTPEPSFYSEHYVLPSSAAKTTGSDKLSPIPIARRMLSRTSSRNLKENNGPPYPQELASPFNSRPGSRIQSPRPGAKKSSSKPVRHSKSRTLSSTIMRKAKKAEEKGMDELPTLNDSDLPAITFDAQYTIGPASNAKLNPPAHFRTGSIPTLNAQEAPPNTWLIPAKALDRPPPDMQFDSDPAFEAMQRSFYFDVPLQVSTPPRKSRTSTTGPWQFRHTPPTLDSSPIPPAKSRIIEDVDMAGSPASESPSADAAARQLTRGRRAVVHMSSDSIFSSAMDFSMYINELDGPHNDGASKNEGATTGSVAVTNLLGPMLGEPFGEGLLPTPVLDPAVILTNTTAGIGSQTTIFSHSRSDREDGQAGTDEVRDLLSGLDLDAAASNDAAVTASAPPEAPAAAKNTRTKEQTHRRKRGDTIRASDFIRPSGSLDSASTIAPAAVESTILGSGVRTRRTRSGTVTLSNAPTALTSTKSQSTARSQGPIHRRMRVAYDEEDDELLLKPRRNQQ